MKKNKLVLLLGCLGILIGVINIHTNILASQNGPYLVKQGLSLIAQEKLRLYEASVPGMTNKELKRVYTESLGVLKKPFSMDTSKMNDESYIAQLPFFKAQLLRIIIPELEKRKLLKQEEVKKTIEFIKKKESSMKYYEK